MSSCYSLNLELIKFKPPTTFSPSNSSSSPSESTTSPRSILTRKARTPRKRPNQTYNEAAAILSTSFPKIFPLKKPLKFTKSLCNRSPPFLSQGPPILMRKTESRCAAAESRVCNYSEIWDDDFSAESLLDEEIEEGIDSIMGMNDAITCNSVEMSACGNGYNPVFDFGRAMRHVDEGDWWRFPCVNVAEITQHIPKEKKKKKQGSSAGLRLNLDYDDVLKEWSDKGSPFSGNAPGAESAGNDVQVRLSQIDLFPEVQRSKEKRYTRLFSKKPKYQITKVHADQRPRSKGENTRRRKPPISTRGNMALIQ
ncbi:hypothetical protein ACS0TY_016756 [Phlomoides rotata]